MKGGVLQGIVSNSGRNVLNYRLKLGVFGALFVSNPGRNVLNRGGRGGEALAL